MKDTKLFFLLFAGLLVLLSGCGGGAGPRETAGDYLADAVAHMNELDGYEFQLSHGGPPVYVDAEGQTKFVNATGHFVSPDKASTKVKISLGSIVAEISVISLGDTQWGSNPLTGSFQELDETYTYKPAKFLNPETGFFTTLGDELTDVALVGEEELEEMPGVTLQLLSGTLPGEVISEVSYGLIADESAEVDLWVDTDADEIHRVLFTDPATVDDEEPSTWQFDFWNFGETVDIEAP
ncbi:MAG: LppX_LprAFG lipoprotein [Anaerolineales bacterium]